MSRYEQTSPRYKMSYGEDHLVGLFITIQEISRMNDEDEGVVVEKDGFHDALTPVEMARIAEKYGFHIELPEDTINI